MLQILTDLESVSFSFVHHSINISIYDLSSFIFVFRSLSLPLLPFVWISAKYEVATISATHTAISWTMYGAARMRSSDAAPRPSLLLFFS